MALCVAKELLGPDNCYCMKEFQKIIEAYECVNFAQERAALATVVKTQGSSYRRPGARMLMTDTGHWTGAISGGCLEGDALRKARQVILRGEPRVVTYDTTNDEDAQRLGVGLGCQGIIDVLLEPLDPVATTGPIHQLRSFLAHRHRTTLATVYRTDGDTGCRIGQRMRQQNGQWAEHTIENKALAHRIAHDLMQIQQSGTSVSKVYEVATGEVEVFLEAMNPAIHLLVFGGGYDAVPVTQLAKAVGWQVTVTDDCVAHLAPKRFPEADVVVAINRHEAAERVPMDAYTAALLISHNYSYDIAVLASLLSTKVSYIGVLGPGKRANRMRNELKTQGRWTEADDVRIHAPVGLDLGAETPDEIALSIVAEIQATFSHRSAGFLRNLDQPIHQKYPIEEERIHHRTGASS